MKRALLLIAAVFAVVVGAGMLSATRACAHDPRFACSPRAADRAIVVADPGKSWAFYGRLGSGAEDRYEIDATHALTVPVQVLIDQRDAGFPTGAMRYGLPGAGIWSITFQVLGSIA